MDSAEPLKKSEEEIKNSKDFSPLGELLQHWHKLLSPHATNALDQLYGLNVWQDQLDTQQTLINDAYLSHVSAKKRPGRALVRLMRDHLSERQGHYSKITCRGEMERSRPQTK